MMYHWPDRRETPDQQHCQGLPAQPKPLKTCPALAHSALSCSTGVYSDLGKEGKDKLFRAMTK